MDRRLALKTASYVVGLVMAFGLGTAVGQQAPPKENKGVATERTGTLDLAGEIEGMKGWQLRLRALKAEPGAVFGLHSHKDRPAVAFVMQGTLTEYREGGYVKEHREGATLTEGKDIDALGREQGHHAPRPCRGRHPQAVAETSPDRSPRGLMGASPSGPLLHGVMPCEGLGVIADLLLGGLAGVDGGGQRIVPSDSSLGSLRPLGFDSTNDGLQICRAVYHGIP